MLRREKTCKILVKIERKAAPVEQNVLMKDKKSYNKNAIKY